jgi:hypothetical protein
MILYDHVPLPDTVEMELWAFVEGFNPSEPETLRTVAGKLLSDFAGIPPIGAPNEGYLEPIQALVRGDLSATLTEPWTNLGSSDGTSQDLDGDGGNYGGIPFSDKDVGRLIGSDNPADGDDLTARALVATGNVGNAFKLADVVFDITSGHPLDRSQQTEINFGLGRVREFVVIGGVLHEIWYPDPEGVSEVTFTLDGFPPRQLTGLVEALRTGGDIFWDGGTQPMTQELFDEIFRVGDPVVLVPAPEPVTLAGLGAGLGALVWKLRRRLA